MSDSEEVPPAPDAEEAETEAPAADEPTEAPAAEDTQVTEDDPPPPPPEPESGQADLGTEEAEAPAASEPAAEEQAPEEPPAADEPPPPAVEEPAAEASPPLAEVPGPEPAQEEEPAPQPSEPAQQESLPEPEPEPVREPEPEPQPEPEPKPVAPPPAPKPAPPAVAPQREEPEPPAVIKKAPAKPEGVESLGDAEVPMYHTRVKDDKPWLEGTFKTPKGRTITGEQLCQSLNRMTNAYVDKYMAIHDEGGQPAPGAAGSLFNTKRLPADELEGVINRLYTSGTRDESSGEVFKMEHVQLKFDDNGKEQWLPVKSVTVDEQKEYMCSLYERCIEQKKRTEEELAAKYLQPLGKPRKVA